MSVRISRPIYNSKASSNFWLPQIVPVIFSRPISIVHSACSALSECRHWLLLRICAAVLFEQKSYIELLMNCRAEWRLRMRDQLHPIICISVWWIMNFWRIHLLPSRRCVVVGIGSMLWRAAKAEVEWVSSFTCWLLTVKGGGAQHEVLKDISTNLTSPSKLRANECAPVQHLMWYHPYMQKL